MSKILILFLIIAVVFVIIDMLSGFRYGALSILAILMNLVFVFLVLFLYANEYQSFVIGIVVTIVVITVAGIGFFIEKKRKHTKRGKQDNIIYVDDDSWK